MARHPSSPAREPEFADACAFAAVVEAKSFTRAAARLGAPKSAISRRVSQLEETLGVRLLVRTTRSLRLTEGGAAYYERVRRVLEAFGDANDEARAQQDEPRGTVRLTAAADFGARVLPELLRRFLEAHPAVRIDLSLTARRVDLVSEGFDVAIRFGRLADSTLVARKIVMDPALVVASPAYLAAHGVPKKVADLRTHVALRFAARDASMTWTLDGPRGPETVPIDGPIAADDMSFTREAALHGLGLAIVPSFLVADDLRDGRLVRVLPKHSLSAGDCHVVYPSARLLPRRVSALVDFLTEAIGPAIRDS
jgi:DNA-binding transcriptional LysR family regulator